MAYINKLNICGNLVSVYKAQNGNTAYILKNSIPNILSRTRSIVMDSANNPVKCKDVMFKKGKLISSDIYTRAKDGSTVIKDKNGVTKLLTNLRFLDIAARFLK